MSTILRATAITSAREQELKDRVERLKSRGIHPKMRVILVGKHPPSILYTNRKKKFCEKIGAACDIISLPQDVSREDFSKQLTIIAQDDQTHGLFVQLPLPPQLEDMDFEKLIPKEKDVDGLHSHNLIALLKGDCGEQALIPCTPKGIVTLLKFYKITIAGASVAVVGRSLIVGKPMALLLTNLNATVTLCHGQTKNLANITQNADIIILATGRPEFFDRSYFSRDKQQTIIDVGIGYNREGKLCGDAHFSKLNGNVHAITPVPGGIGPMTIFSLMQNLLQAAEKSI